MAPASLVCFSFAPRLTERRSKSMTHAPRRLHFSHHHPEQPELPWGRGSCESHVYTAASYGLDARRRRLLPLPLPLLLQPHAAEANMGGAECGFDLRPRTNRRRSAKAASRSCIASPDLNLRRRSKREIDLGAGSASDPGRTGDGHPIRNPRSCKERSSPPRGEPALLGLLALQGMRRSALPSLAWV
jgi:hypothetical protein